MNASIVRWSKTHTLITSLAVVTALFSIFVWQSVLHTVAQSTPQCPTDYAVTIPTGSLTPGAAVSGTAGILFNAPSSSNNVSARKVDFYSNSQGFLGTAVRTNVSTNGSTWSLPLVTQLLPNSIQTMYASVQLSDNNVCNSGTSSATISNTSTAQLLATANPAGFNGSTNTAVNFAVTVKVPQTGLDVTAYSDIQWATTTGTIEKQVVAGTARLFTGPLGQNGKVTATIKYGGKTLALPIQITIAGATNTSGSNDTAPQAGSVGVQTTNSGQQSATAQATTTSSSQQTGLSTSLQDCAVTVLGAPKVASIKSGTIRPSSADLELLKPCFAQTNFIVPTAYAPIAPAKVKELTKSNDISISDLSNVTSQTKQVAIKITGKSAPNTTVLLYVFSEPLVIATSTDAKGTWSYTLEDPLAPGNHEIYAVADMGNQQFAKTDPFSFVLGRTTASADNPDGLSLKLEGDTTPIQTKQGLYLYAAIFGLIFLAGLIFIGWLFRRWKKHNDIPPPSSMSFTTPSPSTGA